MKDCDGWITRDGKFHKCYEDYHHYDVAYDILTKLNIVFHDPEVKAEDLGWLKIYCSWGGWGAYIKGFPTDNQLNTFENWKFENQKEIILDHI